MRNERLLTVLHAPHVSEKAVSVKQQYVFKVSRDTNKFEVKAAVEELFKVTVEQVRIVNVKGKARRFGQIQGRRKSWKKAYVKLAEGSEIEMTGS